jgi:hypothetical protein
MKTFIAAVSLSLLSLTAFAQDKTTKTAAKPAAAKTTASVAYRCPVCGASAAKAGECSKDKTAFVKVGDYYCPDCYMSQSKPGKCSMCGVDMKKMETSSVIPPAKK